MRKLRHPGAMMGIFALVWLGICLIGIKLWDMRK